MACGLVPDWSPLDRSAAARYRWHLADGVEEAYGAIYATEADPRLVEVYALRFGVNERPFFAPSRASSSIHRFEIGPLDVVATGGGGRCSQAIEAYLESLGI